MTPILAADWLTISINLLLVIHVIVCLLLALVVLMQRPKQEGLGAAFGGGLTDQAFGAQTTNVLQKGTVYLGTLFFVITLVLAILIGKRQISDPSMAEDSKKKTEETSGPASESLQEKKKEIVAPEVEESPGPPTAPAAPDTPAEAEAPEAPAAPGAPETETEAEAEKGNVPAGRQPADEQPAEAPAAGGDQ